MDEYDSQARMYYPAIGRTTTLDPHSESYYSVSPYSWCSGNPVNRIDPDGRDDFLSKLLIDATQRITQEVIERTAETVENFVLASAPLAVQEAKNLAPDAVSLNIDGEAAMPIGGVNIDFGVGVVTNGENIGDVFGIFDIGASIVNTGGFSTTVTGGPTLYFNNAEDFSPEDIAGARNSVTAVAGEKVVGKLEYTQGSRTENNSNVKSIHFGAGWGYVYNPLYVLPVSISASVGATNTTKKKK